MPLIILPPYISALLKRATLNLVSPNATYYSVSGYVGSGQLSNGMQPFRYTYVTTGHSFVKISGRFGIKSNGTLWGWGDNTYNVLLLGDEVIESGVPIQIGTDTNWKEVSEIGLNGFLAIKTNGTLWAHGRNQNGCLGLAFASPVNTTTVITQIGTDTDWALLGETQGSSSAAIKTDGRLYGCGTNTSASLGLGVGGVVYGFTLIHNTLRFSAASLASGTASYLTIGGAIYSSGNNTNSSLGTGTTASVTVLTPVAGTNSGYKSISQSGMHCAAVKTDGSLWTWGDNRFGQLLDVNGAGASILSPVQRRTGFTWLRATAISAGYTIALRSDGQLWGEGNNNNGTLGPTITSDDTGFIRVGTLVDTSIFMTSSGGGAQVFLQTVSGLFAAGSGGSGKLGIGNNITDRIPSLTTSNFASAGISSVSMEFYYATALIRNGFLFTVGNNWSGELGTGNTLPVFTLQQVGVSSNWTDVHVRDSMAVKNSNSEVFVCGYNIFYQLGLGHANTVLALTKIAGLWKHAPNIQSDFLCVQTDGTLWAAGANLLGASGIGSKNTNNQSTEAGAIQVLTRVGTASNWVRANMAADSQFSGVLNSLNDLYMAGYNAAGQLGLGDSLERLTHTKVSSNVASFTCGSGKTFIVKTDGTLWAAGSNANGSLGLGDTLSRNVFTQVGSDSDWLEVECGVGSMTVARKINGSVWVAGYNSSFAFAQGGRSPTSLLYFTKLSNYAKFAKTSGNTIFLSN